MHADTPGARETEGADSGGSGDRTDEAGRVQTNGIETYYVRRGEGPPIVFVYGAIMDHRQWEPQVDALSDEYTTVAYDVRGHGRTGGSDAETYSVELFAEDLDALVDALGLQQPILCGLSLGGCIAQVYAARHPEKVAGVVLADTFTAGPLGVGGRLLFANLRFFALLDRVVRYKRLNRFQTWVGQRVAPGIAGDRATVQRLVDEGPTISHPEFVKIMEALGAFPRSDFDISPISAPTLILYGENEPAMFRTAAAYMRERLTGADVEVRVVPDAGHASNLDNPAFFTAAVRELAEETVAGGD